MKKILITGISGFIGQYLHKQKPVNVEVAGTYFSNKPALVKSELVKLDLSNVEEFISNAEKYDVVIHCAAESSLAECEKYPARANKINSMATEKLAQWSANQKSKFIFLSTDIVFDGEKGDYLESENPAPINVYGKTKLDAERRILDIHNNAIIIRLALCLGKGLGNATSFIDWFENKLEFDEEIPLYFDEIRTPVSAKFAASAIWELIDSNFNGIMHLAGIEKINRYDLGLKILDHLKLDKKHLLKRISSESSNYPRPKDVSMKSSVLGKILDSPQEDLNSLIKNIL
jgi:dTDP-4-dehydrorhamnose reductase